MSKVRTSNVKPPMRYNYVPDWSSKTIHGYRFEGNRARREMWISTDINQTIADDSGVWFDGPLLSGQQALEVAAELNRWVRIMREPAATGRHPFSNSLVRLDTVAGELAMMCLCRTNTSISDDLSEFRCMAPITPRRAACLVRELRKLGKQLIEIEAAQ